jgi:hypothetical protein
MRAKTWAAIVVLGLTFATTEAFAARNKDDIEYDDESGGSSGGSSGSIIKDRGRHKRPHMLSLLLNVPWYYGFGIGAGVRYTLPVVHDGFIPKLNDSFELEFGLDYVWRRWGYVGGFGNLNYHSIIIPIEARWTFYFFPNFAAYAKAGLGIDIGFGGGAVFGPFGTVGAGPTVYHNLLAPGLLWEVSDAVHLRAELGYWGFKAGVGFEL